MVTTKKRTGLTASLPKGLLVGLGISICVTVAGSALTAWFVIKETVPFDSVGWFAMGITLLSSLLGAWVASAKIKTKTAAVCALSAGMYYLTLLGMTALFFGGQYHGLGTTAIAVAVGSALALVIKNAGKMNTGSRRKIKAYR